MGLDKNKELLEGCEWLEKFEGYRSEIYFDTENIETVGIGRNLEVYPFDDEEQLEYDRGGYSHTEAVAWAYSKLAECRFNLMVHKPWLVEAPHVVRLICTDMVYNLGLQGALGFRKMHDALKLKDYKQAALELQDSKYFKQTGQRSLHHYRKLMELVKYDD